MYRDMKQLIMVFLVVDVVACVDGGSGVDGSGGGGDEIC